MTVSILRRLAAIAAVTVTLASAADAYIRSELDGIKPGINIEAGQIRILVRPEFAPLNIRFYDKTPITGVASLDALADIYGVTEIRKTFHMKETPKDSNVPDLSRYYEITFPPEMDVEAVGLAYEKCVELEEVEFVSILRKLYIPNDPRYNQQWHLRRCGFPAAWDETHGSREIKIGIVDSGMDMPFDDFGEADIHEDISGNLWINPGEDINHDGVITQDDWDGQDNDGDGYADNFHGWDITGNNNWPDDYWGSRGGQGHGTHVAGIASMTTDNEVGGAGAAFSASLVIAACYSFQSDSLIANGWDGITFCGEMGCDVINLSWGSSRGANNSERAAVNFARQRGSIIFAAAGNDNISSIHYPAGYEGIIAVAASSDNDNKADFSNFGNWVDLVAPGDGIVSTIPHNRYASYPGTSMASPLACGLGALILSVQDLNEADLLQWMQRTAVDISEINNNQAGIRYRINADFAINAVHPKFNLLEWNLLELEGDEDGRAEPQERVVLEFLMENMEGYSDASNVRAFLSTDDTTIHIERASVQLGNFNGGQLVFSGDEDGIRFVVRHYAKPHYTTLNLTFTDESGHSDVEEIKMTIGRPSYLLVDDDEGAAFDTLLSADLNARPIVHDVWPVDSLGSPRESILMSYENVIWETGNARDALSVIDQANLTAFLNSGGKGLILSGQFLGEDIGETDFHRDMLHAGHVADNTGGRRLLGVPGNELSDGDTLLLVGGGGAGNSTSPSAIEPLDGADTLFTYDNEAGQVGAISYLGDDYSLVYFGFALEAISGGGRTANRTEVLQKILDRFYALEAPSDPMPITPTSFALEAPYPNPFNARTAIKVAAPAGKEFRLQVIDLAGRLVATLHEGQTVGTGTYVWDGEAAPAGVYLFRLTWDGGSMTQKAALLK